MKIKGLDELINDLEQLESNSRKLSETESIPLDDLFSESFMENHTDFNNIHDFFEHGGFIASNQEEFDSIDTEELDKYVSSSTKFESFQEMLNEAAHPYIEDALFNNL